MRIHFSEIEDAFMFVNMGQAYGNMAYLSRESGKFYFYSEYGDNYEELPDDIDEPTYVAIPDQNELGLGKNLALEFAHRFIEQKVEYVAAIFRKKGAYARFKNLLVQLGELDHWYQYEEEAQRKNLLQWCQENEISLADEHTDATGQCLVESAYVLPENVRRDYLKNTAVIDRKDPLLVECARKLMSGCRLETEYIKKAFAYVRDEIRHSWDYRLNPVTCNASEVLRYKTGYCYAKSHLLAALLRAREIPVGFCYQRLSVEGSGPPYCLHGLNAVYLENHGWYRMDARGNKEGINAEFTPPEECLAFAGTGELEMVLPEIWPDPLPQIVKVLKSYKTVEEVHDNLPDIQVK